MARFHPSPSSNNKLNFKNYFIFTVCPAILVRVHYRLIALMTIHSFIANTFSVMINI